MITAALLSACGRVGYDATADAASDLRLTAPTAPLNLGSAATVVATGGAPPYSFAVIAGDGTIDAVTGRFRAPDRPGQTMVAVADAAGALATAAIAHRGSTLFLLGGQLGGVPQDAVFASTDGATWTQVGQLPAARDSGSAFVWDDRLFYLGGVDAGLASRTEVWASSDGVTWSTVGALPAPVASAADGIHDDALWLAGGWHSADLREVYRSVDGATWTTAGALPIGRHEADLQSHDGALYVFGGHQGAAYPVDVLRSDDGASWTTVTGQVNIATDFTGAGWHDGYAYRGGGYSVAVERSADLATWTYLDPLPAPREGPALVSFDGRLLVIGGHVDVLASPDGRAWQTIGALPDDRGRVAVVQFTPR
jgi:hypothetical protein